MPGGAEGTHAAPSPLPCPPVVRPAEGARHSATSANDRLQMSYSFVN